MSAAYPWLVADVGGTNARFGTVAGPGAAVEDVRVLPVAGHAGPAAAVRAYLAGQPAGQPKPRSAAFALATALDGDRIELTNGAWSFSRSGTQEELGLQTLLMVLFTTQVVFRLMGRNYEAAVISAMISVTRLTELTISSSVLPDWFTRSLPSVTR